MRQSKGQVNGFSLGAQNPSPHLEQVPQSVLQLAQLSPAAGSQIPLPQKPQSKGHELGVSPKVHWPSPHLGGALQSVGQVKSVSPGPQMPSPQKLIGPQS
jgi:hypothetical protein